MEFLEKQARSATIEIRNIPKQDQENKQTLINIVKAISASLSMGPPLKRQKLEIYTAEVRDLYRSMSDSTVVDFICTARKEDVVSGYRKLIKTRRENKEPQLNATQLKIPGTPRTIYISDFLASEARHLYYLASRRSKKQKTYCHLDLIWEDLCKKRRDGTSTRRLRRRPTRTHAMTSISDQISSPTSFLV